MTHEEFDILVKERFTKTLEVMTSKSKEYASDTDILSNFKRAGIKSNQSPEKALRGFLLKHEVSIDDIIDKLDQGILPSKDLIDEKFGDALNYNLLQYALLIERINVAMVKKSV